MAATPGKALPGDASLVAKNHFHLVIAILPDDTQRLDPGHTRTLWQPGLEYIHCSMISRQPR
ncbi:MAG: hypothetical protein WBM38_15375 [Arenicellales bacterium]